MKLHRGKSSVRNSNAELFSFFLTMQASIRKWVRKLNEHALTRLCLNKCVSGTYPCFIWFVFLFCLLISGWVLRIKWYLRYDDIRLK